MSIFYVIFILHKMYILNLESLTFKYFRIMVTFSEKVIGQFKIGCDCVIPIEIRQGNALAVFVYDSGDRYTRYSFIADKSHLRNLIRDKYDIFNGAYDIILYGDVKGSSDLYAYLTKFGHTFIVTPSDNK